MIKKRRVKSLALNSFFTTDQVDVCKEKILDFAPDWLEPVSIDEAQQLIGFQLDND